MSPEHHKNIHATLGSLGGLKRKERLTAQERSAIARHAAQAPPRSPGNTRTRPGDHVPYQTGVKRRQATTPRLTLA